MLARPFSQPQHCFRTCCLPSPRSGLLHPACPAPSPTVGQTPLLLPPGQGTDFHRGPSTGSSHAADAPPTGLSHRSFPTSPSCPSLCSSEVRAALYPTLRGPADLPHPELPPPGPRPPSSTFPWLSHAGPRSSHSPRTGPPAGTGPAEPPTLSRHLPPALCPRGPGPGSTRPSETSSGPGLHPRYPLFSLLPSSLLCVTWALAPL